MSPVLAFTDARERASLHAIDVSTADPSPWQIADADIRRLDWSPRGDWIVAVAADSGRQRTLIACAAEPGPPGRTVHGIAEGDGDLRFVWSPFGRIWFRPSDAQGNWKFFEPPAEWNTRVRRDGVGGDPPLTTYLTVDAPWVTVDPATCITAVTITEDWPKERLLPILQANTGSARVIDIFPGGQFVLARIVPNESFASIAVLNLEGRVRSRFTQVLEPVTLADGTHVDRTTFEPHAVTQDGALLIGVRRIEDAKGVAASVLCAADVEGRWIAPIEGAPQGVAPRCSRMGLWVAVRELHAPVVHVGRLELEDG
jgi:hypothetical protein